MHPYLAYICLHLGKSCMPLPQSETANVKWAHVLSFCGRICEYMLVCLLCSVPYPSWPTFLGAQILTYAYQHGEISVKYPVQVSVLLLNSVQLKQEFYPLSLN